MSKREKKNQNHQNDSTKFPLPLFIEMDKNLKFSFSTSFQQFHRYPSKHLLCSGVQGEKDKENQQTACLLPYNITQFLRLPINLSHSCKLLHSISL